MLPLVLALLSFSAASDAPVAVTAGQLAPGAGDSVNYQFSFINSGVKNIAAVCFKIRVTGRAGEVLWNGRLGISTSALVPASAAEPFAPGRAYPQTVQIPLQPSQLAVSSIEIQPDYVEFDDRSFWGPDTLNYSLYFRGMRAGALIERRAARR